MDANPVPPKVLSRLGRLTARCAAVGRDDAARASLARLASECNDRYPAISEEAIATLARDSESGIRDAASIGLADLLAHLDGLARLSLTIEWATSSDDRQRLAIARALGTRVTGGVGIFAVLDELVHDRHPEIRRAACLSCGAGIDGSSAALTELLAICARDPIASIRSAALDALGRAAGGPAGRDACEALFEIASSKNTDLSSAALLALEKRFRG